MKKALALLLVLFIGMAAWAQTVDLRSVNPATVDLRKSDLSEVEFYFNGPTDFLVRNVYYDGVYYSAVLQYDGQGTFYVTAPPSTSTQGLPMSLDLSNIEVSMTETGLQLSNVVADGYRFAGHVVPNLRTIALEMDSPLTVLGPARPAAATAVATAAPDNSATVRSLQATIARLEGQIESLRDDTSDQRTAIADREQEIQQKDREIARLEQRVAGVAQAPARASTPMEDAAQVTRSVLSGFSSGSAVLGDWRATTRALTQTNAEQLYAKYVIPVRQTASKLVYEFSGNSTGSGWGGFGLHFMASTSTMSQGYGYGSSYLAWVTRDPARTQTEQTFLQLYKSFDDVRMIELASKAIDVPIDRDMNVTVYVDRSTSTIYVAVNGEQVIDFTDSAMYRTGTAVAPRALGNAQFTNLQVKAR